mgnify:CR=1 FL=1
MWHIWKSLLNHVHEVLAKRNELAELSEDDLAVVNTNWQIANRNKQFGANVIVKYCSENSLA